MIVMVLVSELVIEDAEVIVPHFPATIQSAKD